MLSLYAWPVKALLSDKKPKDWCSTVRSSIWNQNISDSIFVKTLFDGGNSQNLPQALSLENSLLDELLF